MPPEMRSVSSGFLGGLVFWTIGLFSFSPSAGGCSEGAGGDQPSSEAVHGQNNSGHSGPQPIHPGDQELSFASSPPNWYQCSCSSLPISTVCPHDTVVTPLHP